MACAAALLGVTPTPARPGQRHVLLLYSYEREFSHFTFARLFRPELARRSPEPIDFIEISLQTVRASRPEADSVVLDVLRRPLAGRALDLVVTMGGPAASFAQQHRAELFPDTPVLITAVDSRFLGNGPLANGVSVIAVKHDPVMALENILHLMPDTRTVMVVIGASSVEQFWLQEVRRSFRPFESRVNFIWTNHLSFADLISASSTLPARSAILYGIWSLDAKGVPQLEDQTLDALHAAANAPMFGLHSHQLGHGIVGGPLISMDDVSHQTADVALRMLKGEPAGNISPRTLAAGTPIFDRRELRRWAIDDTRLGTDSVVRFDEPTSWQRYQGLIVAGVSLVAAQVVIVIALVIGRSRRLPSINSGLADVGAAEATLAQLSQRLMQAREHERASIARAIHDDVSQEMTRLTLTLQGLGSEPAGSSADLRTRIEDLCTQFQALGREIVAISDPLYHRLELLGLGASARAYSERRCAEAGVEVTFASPNIPDTIPADVSLAVFRVLEEALANALAHSSTRRVRVSLCGSNDMVTLDVADEGIGFDVEAALERGAVGLIGIRERLRLVGGTCAIESRLGVGTRVRAQAPLRVDPEVGGWNNSRRFGRDSTPHGALPC